MNLQGEIGHDEIAQSFEEIDFVRKWVPENRKLTFLELLFVQGGGPGIED